MDLLPNPNYVKAGGSSQIVYDAERLIKSKVKYISAGMGITATSVNQISSPMLYCTKRQGRSSKPIVLCLVFHVALAVDDSCASYTSLNPTVIWIQKEIRTIKTDQNCVTLYAHSLPLDFFELAIIYEQNSWTLIQSTKRSRRSVLNLKFGI